MKVKLITNTDEIIYESEAETMMQILNELQKQSINGFIIIDKKCYNLKSINKIEECTDANKSQKRSQKAK